MLDGHPLGSVVYTPGDDSITGSKVRAGTSTVVSAGVVEITLLISKLCVVPSFVWILSII